MTKKRIKLFKAPIRFTPSRRGDKSKSIEVKVRLPLTKVSIMSLLLACLLTLIGYAGYLGVNSVWKFTHPQFNVSLDSLKSLQYIAKGVPLPAIPGPIFNEDDSPTDIAKANYLKAINEFEKEFRKKHPYSRLLNISDNELLNIGTAFCTAKKEVMTKSGKYSRKEIIETFQATFVLRYFYINGLSDYLDGVAQSAFDQLCGEK